MREGLFDDSGWHGCDGWYSDECKNCTNLVDYTDYDAHEYYLKCKCYPDCEYEESEKDNR